MAVVAMACVSCGGTKANEETKASEETKAYKKSFDCKPKVKGTFAWYYNVENVNLSFEQINNDEFLIIARFDVVKNEEDIKNEIGNLTPLCTNGSDHWSYDWGNDGYYRWGCCLKVLDPQFKGICTLDDVDINPLLDHFINPGDKFEVEWKEIVKEYYSGYETLMKYVNGELEGDPHTEVVIGGGVWSGGIETNYK